MQNLANQKYQSKSEIVSAHGDAKESVFEHW